MFSTCSDGDFEDLVLRGGGVCLLNVPSQDSVISEALCGNGILEGAEQCDCGSPQVREPISELATVSSLSRHFQLPLPFMEFCERG